MNLDNFFWWPMGIMWVVTSLRVWVMGIVRWLGMRVVRIIPWLSVRIMRVIRWLGMRIVWIVRRLSMGIVRVIVTWRWSSFDDNVAWISTVRVVMFYNDLLSRHLVIRIMMWILMNNLDNMLWWATMMSWTAFSRICLERGIISHEVRFIPLI